MTLKKCKLCDKKGIGVSEALGVCINCIREKPEEALLYTKEAHDRIRSEFNLPLEPPKDPEGIPCGICANECKIGLNGIGYCGLRKNVDGKLIQPLEYGLVHTYLDPLPTNCCAGWFCPGSKERGFYNLAVFFYGCNFDCIFCQNSSHKSIDSAPRIDKETFVNEAIKNEKISCICYFGGSPEPHLPFALKVSEKILESKSMRICWEWNGCGNEKLVRKAAELSFKSNGIVKFDLKAFDRNLSLALSGVSNERAYSNFRIIAEEFFDKREEPVLTATTLLVPEYVDKKEVENIARFIAELNPEIPYSLLVFHPSFYMSDMPITPRKQVDECYKVARKYLKNVNIGNIHLL